MKGNYVGILSLGSTIRDTKLKVKPPATTLKKQRFSKLTAMWKKGCDACKKKSMRCNRKTTFHYKGKLRAGLNEIKHDYVDSKMHFYLQYHIAATDMKPLCKKQTTLQAVAYLGFPARCNLMLYCNYLIPRTRFSCLCCWRCIDYIVKKLIRFKCVTYFSLENI